MNCIGYGTTIIILIIGLCIQYGCRAVVTEQPSNSQILVIPASPGSGFIYINDSWRWNHRAHAYRVSNGYWVKPKKSAVWVDGHWKQTRGGWKYANGHWR